MAELTIRTDFGDFDLFGDEDVVHTQAIFNFEDITTRFGEYSNEFNLPLTSNNETILRHANFITAINTLAYQKVSSKIIIDGLEFKSGFVEITGIKDTIRCKFYSGNTIFYDKIKTLSLPDLSWSNLDHIWNLDNAVASSANTEGYTYPVMSYNNQSLGGDIVDIRRILPSTFIKTIIDKIAAKTEYTIDYNFDTSDLDVALLPFSKKNPELSAELLLANSVDVSVDMDYDALFDIRQFPLLSNRFFFQSAPLIPASNQYKTKLNLIDTVGSSGNYDFTNQKFTAVVEGNYDYTSFITFDDYDYILFSFTQTIQDVNYINTTTKAVILLNGSVVNTHVLSTGALGQTTINSTTAPAIPQTVVATTISGTVYLQAGDTLEIGLSYDFNGQVLPDDLDVPVVMFANIHPVIKGSSPDPPNTLNIDLQNALNFGNIITYSSILPKIKCSDFLKDQFIRFGLMIFINEDTKVISLNRFDDVYSNLLSADNFTSKLDETEPPEIKYKYDSYAQKNNFLHAEDKTVTDVPEGTNFVLSINNENLDPTKDLYKSPFAPSTNVTFNGYTVAYINSYTSNDRFETDVMPRIFFSEKLVNQFKFTDGTTTSSYLTASRVWFIDPEMPELSMGFGIGLMNKNSKALISVLQNLKLIKARFNLNMIDLLNINNLNLVLIEQFQSYFFISSINQFNYTNPGTTEFELIKLN